MNARVCKCEKDFKWIDGFFCGFENEEIGQLSSAFYANIRYGIANFAAGNNFNEPFFEYENDWHLRYHLGVNFDSNAWTSHYSSSIIHVYSFGIEKKSAHFYGCCWY